MLSDGYDDGITQDITSSLESLETVILYDRIKKSNNEQKIRMIKRLNNVYTKSIYNKQIVNSIEEYTSRYDRSIEDANPSKLKQFLGFLKKIIKIIWNAIRNFINSITSIITKKVKYYTANGKYSWDKSRNSLYIDKLLNEKLIVGIVNSKICIAKPNLSKLEKMRSECLKYIDEYNVIQKQISKCGKLSNDSEKNKYIQYTRNTIESLKKLETFFETPELKHDDHISNQQSIVKSFFDYETLPYKMDKKGHVTADNREIKKIIDTFYNDSTNKWVNVATQFIKYIKNLIEFFDRTIDDIDDILADPESIDIKLNDIHIQLANQLETTLSGINSFFKSLMRTSISLSNVIDIIVNTFIK